MCPAPVHTVNLIKESIGSSECNLNSARSDEADTFSPAEAASAFTAARPGEDTGREGRRSARAQTGFGWRRRVAGCWEQLTQNRKGSRCCWVRPIRLFCFLFPLFKFTCEDGEAKDSYFWALCWARCLKRTMITESSLDGVCIAMVFPTRDVS